MRIFITALFICSASEALAQRCDSTDMRENMKFCTINAQQRVKDAFCRELKEGNASQALSSMNDCQKDQPNHDQIMNNARACGQDAVLKALQEFSGNLDCH